MSGIINGYKCRNCGSSQERIPRTPKANGLDALRSIDALNCDFVGRSDRIRRTVSFAEGKELVYFLIDE
jgi:hypothetical protein